MCGGSLEIAAGTTVIECEYCGTQQTLPKLDDDKRANMYDRANHFRRNNEFDKAMGIYENILNEDNTDAEAYWSLVLCRYGIEYVEDPTSHKRIPTVNRAQFTSIFDDDNYKSALQYADSYQRTIYEAEAKAINEIQKGILAISQKEEPFDVFICYKESDNNGRRTPDSVLAQDLYYQLKQEGFKVFFARITLEDKLGSAYEPYIFAALNSAKVMVVLGTKPEFFNAVWVKNEWSRYLALIKQGQKKMLIPAYKDMDPYDLPEEFSHLQAQDMSKLGFMQDLIRGIKKIAKSDEPKTTVVKETVVTNASANTAPLIKRVFMFLEDSKWSEANEYCEKVLDVDPECAEAYLGKLLAELKVQRKTSLEFYSRPFDYTDNYNKIVRFGSDALVNELKRYNVTILERNEAKRKEDIFIAASELAKQETSDKQLAAAEEFKKIPGYRDSDARVKECIAKSKELGEIERKDAIYAEALDDMKKNGISSIESAIKKFQSVIAWKDSENKIEECNKKIANIKDQQEQKRIADEKASKKRKKIIAIVASCICAVIAFIIIFNIPPVKYSRAMNAIEKQDYVKAYEILITIENYKDSAAQISDIKPDYHIALIKKASVGDVVKFGAYEQDGNTSNGKEDIEWEILEIRGNKVLLISDKILDVQPYHAAETGEYITWEKCSLRAWLNSTFYNTAFSEKCQSKISTTTVIAHSMSSMLDPGNNTQDKVFLLSGADVNKYHPSQASETEYGSNPGCWWLTSPSGYALGLAYAEVVWNDGEMTVYHKDWSAGVRPVIWVEID